MNAMEYYLRLLPESERDFFHYMPTINELVAFAGAHFADDLALDGVAGPVTYRQMIDALGGLRGFLRAQGVQPATRSGCSFRIPRLRRS